MPSIAIPVSLRGQLLSGARQTLTNILFSASEPGFTFEPWDITTLYQDRAGTTPVTAAGQSVGLRLSKDQGLRQGPELSANPGNPFTTTTGFTAATSTVSLVAGRIKTFIPAATSGAAGIYWDTTVTANKAQKIVMDLEAEGRTFEVRIYNGASFATLLASDTISAGVRRNVSFTVTPTTSAVRVYILEASGVDRSVYLASVSVRELPGNHQVAVSDAKRGVYGWMPKTGRRNLLTYTEQFDNAAWVKLTGATAPSAKSVSFSADGFSRITQTISIASATSLTMNVKFSIDDVGKVVRLGLWSSGLDGLTTGNSGNLTIPPSGVVSFTWSSVTSASTIGIVNSSAAASQTLTVAENGGPQLEVGSTATAYQRVVSQYDITEAGVPTCYYVQADGVDDAYVTPTITPNTDKVQVFAGVRKLSDAAIGMVCEFSPNVNTNAGTFWMAAPIGAGAANYDFSSKGTTGQSKSRSGFAAPHSAVLTGLGDISADSVNLRVNGNDAGAFGGDQGTGNYLAYPAYIYGRGGTSLPFNGLDFGHAVRFGPNLDAATIARVESLIARNTPEVTL